MGGFLSRPQTDKDVEVGEGNGLRYCVSSMQGWRCEMEDTHAATFGIHKAFPNWSYFGVFDGHGGKDVALHCAENMLHTIVKTDEFSQMQFKMGIWTGFLHLDEQIRKGVEKTGGSTAICCFVSPKQIYFANCGDSRAVLCREGKAAFCTVDHKPTSAIEKDRIQKAGGSVMVKRVNGSLAVSRAIGDFYFKGDLTRGSCQQMVTPEPDVTVQQRSASDEFIILACDGIWDVMTSDEVCAFIHYKLCITWDLPEIVNSVLEICLNKGSRDNMTLMIVILPGAPKIDDDAVAADKKLDNNIAQMVREVMVKYKIFDYEILVRTMKRKASNIPNLPPGGGLCAKYHVIEQVYQEAFPHKPHEFHDYFNI
ncbi:protein phosphatase 1B [Drosophila bipectinata]|uniref:protein phosphatase 1B n=1 Tax=Drosophila bipectinata TaxID=42026 RepID=UPI001C88F7F2|nr:protein phosphatase 1B [Drosophila bipectinata]